MQRINIFGKECTMKCLLTINKTWNIDNIISHFPTKNYYISQIGNKTKFMGYSHVKKMSTLPFDNLSKISDDVLLFSYEKSKLLKYLAYFGVIQLAFWAYLGHNMYSSLRDIKKEPATVMEEYQSKHPLWRKINLGERKFRIIAFVSCMMVGVSTAFITFTLPLRIVRHLLLRKGGDKVCIITYGPFGRTREVNVPLAQVSCQVSRTNAKSYISVKVKGHWLYFLLDCRGTFNHPQLFDFTVGAARAKLF